MTTTQSFLLGLINLTDLVNKMDLIILKTELTKEDLNELREYRNLRTQKSF